MPRTLAALIPTIIERFDFEKVHKVMTFLNWRWAMTSAGYAVPSVAELRSEAIRLLQHSVSLWEQNGSPATGMNVSTGGIQANVIVFASGESTLQLLFYVDEYSTSHHN